MAEIDANKRYVLRLFVVACDREEPPDEKLATRETMET